MIKKKGINKIFFILLILSISFLAMPADAEIMKGTISVTSSPTGADIYLNNEYLGRQTNAVILDVFPGIHFIRLELDGYRTWEDIFEVKEGQISYVSHEMEPLVGGLFTVSTKPTGARIYIDGEFYGISNTVLSELPAGQHTVLLTLDNYSDYAKTVIINEGMPQSVVHTFEPLPTTGRIIFESVPSNAQVFLNGEMKGTTRLTLDEVLPGTYDVVIKKTGYDDWKGRVDVAAGKISEVKADLSLSKVNLSVQTTPPGAEVFLNGNLLGESPVLASVEQGSATITVEKFGYESITEKTEIGLEGALFSFNLVSMAPQAIEKAAQAVSDNLIYNPKDAEKALFNAEESLAAGDSESAINYAKSAIELALDVDSDGVLNSLDISPNLNNMVIYVSPVIILILIAGFFVWDISEHRVRPEISMNVPATVKEDDMLARAHITADAPGGAHRGFVCTVYIDGVPADHFTDPGKYDVMLSGRSPGEHIITAHLQVAKERYGRAEKKAEAAFTVLPAEHSGVVLDSEAKSPSIIDTEEYSKDLDEYYEEKKNKETES
ncbi:MAG: PEGA domain-containing protein [Methanomicrobiaceae archaeon]|nr:PEGA domain-containing protein [Methanomicrobiaceae archaeon]